METHWQPTAEIVTLQQRAIILEKIRLFFKERNILEVETPLLCQTTATDPYINSFETFFTEVQGKNQKKFYLQTSPEFAMKRLLAAGIGSIYQICKAFRNEETGRLHNPEFTILEWYRIGFDHHQLMDEMDNFLFHILGKEAAERYSYDEIFQKHLQITPHEISSKELISIAKQKNLHIEGNDLSKDDWLQLLMMHCIEPQLGQHKPTFIYDFPVSQAALAKIKKNPFPVGERFEVYIEGIEIANGYHELCDAKEQQKRFESDQRKRKEINAASVPLDLRLLDALNQGLPSCAGVALGIDRLIMLALHKKKLKEIIAFPIEKA